MKSYYIAALAAYIAGLTGYALAGVGQLEQCSAVPLNWQLPAVQFGMVSIPAIFGWLIGRTQTGSDRTQKENDRGLKENDSHVEAWG